MDLKNRVGLRIKTLRKERDLTQEELAEKIDRTKDAVSNLERGLSLPSFETLEIMSKVFEVPIRDFFDLEDEEDADRERVELTTRLIDAARNLENNDLRVAVQQIEALLKRS